MHFVHQLKFISMAFTYDELLWKNSIDHMNLIEEMKSISNIYYTILIDKLLQWDIHVQFDDGAWNRVISSHMNDVQVVNIEDLLSVSW